MTSDPLPGNEVAAAVNVSEGILPFCHRYREEELKRTITTLNLWIIQRQTHRDRTSGFRQTLKAIFEEANNSTD